VILDDLMLSNVSSITGMAQSYAIILTTQREIYQTIKQKCPTFGFLGLWIWDYPNRPVQRSFFVGLCEIKFPWVRFLILKRAVQVMSDEVTTQISKR